MGKKVLQFGTILMGAAGFLSFVSLFLPMHRVSMFGSLFKLGTITTYTLRYHWRTEHASTFCSADSTNFFCNDGSRDLTTIKDQSCNNLMQGVVPQLCEGFTDARTMGLTLVLTVSTQIVLQIVSGWLNYQYTSHSPKKKYRDTSLILMILSALVTWLALMFYFFFVIQKLNNLHSSTSAFSAIGLSVFSFSQGSAGIGYIIMWVSVILQMIATILFKFGKVKEERMLKEAKNEQRFEAEMAMHGGGGFDPYQPAAYGPGYGQPQGFGDPFAQQDYGPQAGYPPQQDPYAQQQFAPADPYAQQQFAPADPYAQQQYGQQGQYGYDPSASAPMPGGAPYWPAA